MSRPQPRTARPWLLRGLLVLLTLTGLGIWQGGRCADASTYDTTSIAASSAAAATNTATVETGTTAAAHSHRDPHTAGPPGTTVDTCHIAPGAVTRTTTTAALPLPAVDRAAPVAASARPLTPRCFSPGVALNRLGISRT